MDAFLVDDPHILDGHCERLSTDVTRYKWLEATAASIVHAIDGPTLWDIIRRGEDHFIRVAEPTYSLQFSRAELSRIYRLVEAELYRILQREQKRFSVVPRL